MYMCTVCLVCVTCMYSCGFYRRKVSSLRVGRVDLPVLPGVQFLQVDQDVVTFRKRYTKEKLESLVAENLYPPAIHYSVVYSTPPDYDRASVGILEVRMTGTNQSQVSFPIKVYNAIGKYGTLMEFLLADCSNYGTWRNLLQ